MSKTAILRFKRLKSTAAVAGSVRHNARLQETQNADPELAKKNQLLGCQTPDAALARMREIHAEIEASKGSKIRANAVPMVEALMTYSPDTKLNVVEWARVATQWLIERVGAENVIQVALHRDETTPHIHLLFVPRMTRANKAGKPVQSLNAAEVIGNRTTLTRWQDDYHKNVGERFGLERGVRGSKAKHQTIKKFYGALSATEKAEKLNKGELAEQLKFMRIQAATLAERVKTLQPLAKRVESAEHEAKQREIERQQAERKMEREAQRADLAEQRLGAKYGAIVERESRAGSSPVGPDAGRREAENNRPHHRNELGHRGGRGGPRGEGER